MPRSRFAFPLKICSTPSSVIFPCQQACWRATSDSKRPDDSLDRLTNYGSLFIGEETTVAYGDKSIGTNNILPTSRAARYTGGVWVGKFLKTVTYQRMTKAASVEVGRVTERQCEAERMLAHAITARIRIHRFS